MSTVNHLQNSHNFHFLYSCTWVSSPECLLIWIYLLLLLFLSVIKNLAPLALIKKKKNLLLLYTGSVNLLLKWTCILANQNRIDMHGPIINLHNPSPVYLTLVTSEYHLHEGNGLWPNPPKVLCLIQSWLENSLKFSLGNSPCQNIIQNFC